MREVPQYISQLSMGSMPKVQYSMAQAEATQKMSAQLGALGEEIYQKDVQIQKIRATTELQTTLNKQYQEFGSDPGKLKEAQEGFRTGFIKGIKDPDLAAQFEAQYDALAMPYLNKSTEIYADNQDKALKLSIMEGTEIEIASAEAIGDGLASNIPEHQEASGNALLQGMTRIEQYKTAKNRDGSMMFSPSEIIAEEKRVQAAYNKKANAIRVAPMEKMLFSDPAGLAVKIDAGEFDGRFKDQKEKEKYLDNAIKHNQDIQKREGLLSVLKLNQDNQELAQAYEENSPDLPRLLEEAEAKGADPKIIETIKKNVIKHNKLPADVAQAEYNSLMTRVSELDEKKRVTGKLALDDDVTLEDLAVLSRDLQRATVRGVKNLTPFIKRIQPALLEKANNERGKDDLGQWDWMNTDETYDTAYEVINAHLKASGQMENGASRQELITKFVSGMDDLPPEIKADPLKFEKAMDEMAQKVVKSDAKKRLPISRTLGDAPNAVIRDNGQVETLGDFKSDIKPDQKVTDAEVRLLKDKDGKIAREYIKDGKRVKIEVLNSDGSVKKEVLY